MSVECEINSTKMTPAPLLIQYRQEHNNCSKLTNHIICRPLCNAVGRQIIELNKDIKEVDDIKRRGI